jgi:predicted dehydrogenase
MEMITMERRIFLLGTAGAAQTAFSQGAGDRIGTAMIGTGSRGSGVLKGILEQPGVRVTALCDIKPDRLDSAASAAARDNPATEKDWRKVIERKDVEAVYVTTPPYLHSEMAIAALKAGKHVYCEKPIGVTPEQVRELVKVARESKKVFHCGQQMRSFKQMGQAIEKIRQGAIGDVVMVKAQRHATADHPHDASSADWYFNDAKSGGFLIEQSVHNLDACNWAIGNHPLRGAGFGGTLIYKNDPPSRDIMDSSSLTFEYPNGVHMTFTQNVFHPRGLPSPNQNIYVYGTEGAVDLLNGTNLYLRGSQNAELTPLAPKQEEPPHEHTAVFFNCIRTGAKSNADIVVGATAALTAIMGHDACLKKKIINWSDFGIDLG